MTDDYEQDMCYVFTSEKSLKVVGRGLVKVVNLKGWTVDKVRNLVGSKAVIDGDEYTITGTEYGSDGLSNYRVIGFTGLIVKQNPDEERKS